jgi:hypothetical protein
LPQNSRDILYESHFSNIKATQVMIIFYPQEIILASIAMKSSIVGFKSHPLAVSQRHITEGHSIIHAQVIMRRNSHTSVPQLQNMIHAIVTKSVVGVNPLKHHLVYLRKATVSHQNEKHAHNDYMSQ